VAGGEGRCGGQGRLAAEAAGCRRLSIQVVEGGEKYAEQDLMVCGKYIFSLLITTYLQKKNQMSSKLRFRPVPVVPWTN
jgi:hypothetical protein